MTADTPSPILPAASEAMLPEGVVRVVVSLCKRRDFLQVQGSPHRFSRPSFLLACLPLAALGEQVGVGYTVTKKLGNAVQRNRVKRRLREIARPLLAEQGRPGHAYVWIARGAAADEAFVQLGRDMRWALRKLHTLMDENPNPGPARLRGRGAKKHKPVKAKPAAPAAGDAPCTN